MADILVTQPLIVGSEDPELREFLTRHPDIVPLLAPAREALLRAFSGSRVTAQVDNTFDPDYNQDRDQLVLTVWTSVYVGSTDTVDRLYRFYDEWVPAHLDDDDSPLRFDVGIE